MKTAILSLLVGLVLTGCAFNALKPGRSSVSPGRAQLQQSENPKTESTQNYERTVETVFALPEENQVTSRPVKTIVTEKVDTKIGAAQKDTGREVAAKLSSLKGVVWVGVILFIFGAASAFYPPLKLVVGSTTTSAVACAAGLALIVLPSLIVGHEVLILAVAGGAVGVWWFAHRHGSIHSALKTLKDNK